MTNEVDTDHVEREEVEAKNQVVNDTANDFDDVEDDAQEQTVAYESYQKVLNQRKADKRKAQELEAKLKNLQEQIRESETRKLEEKQEYKKLYEATKAELEAKEQEKRERDKIIANKEKQSALSKELGGLKNDAYFKFADLDSIVIGDDGQIDQTSLRLEANRFRTAYPELITPSQKVRINNQAPSNDGVIIPQERRSADKMSASEREEHKRSILMKNIGKN